MSKTGKREKEPAPAAPAPVAPVTPVAPVAAAPHIEDVANRLFAFVFLSILTLIAFIWIFDTS